MEPFRFKQFTINHHKSSMKIGVDAVLLGAWAGLDPKSVLDVGTGCGIIALILAQRFPLAKIKAIDIDKNSIEEATENFNLSPWSHNISADLIDFQEIDILDKKYDLIVSNPPYFKSGIEKPSTPREIARHQGTLSIFSLIEKSPDILNENGRLSLIFPLEFYDKAISSALGSGFSVVRECRVKDNPKKQEKRVMIEFVKNHINSESKTVTQHLTLFNGLNPTPEYRSLCSSLYLKF